MPTDLVLVRHASSVVPTPDGPDELSRPLREAGMAQARALVDELLALEPTAAVSSPYLRAVQTVAPAAGAAGLTVATRWDLREWDSGLEPTPDYARHHALSWADPGFARPGGESLDALTGRALAALGAVAREHEGGVVLVGTHGTFAGRVLLAAGHPVDWPFLETMPMPAVYQVRWDGGPTAITGPGIPRTRPSPRSTACRSTPTTRRTSSGWSRGSRSSRSDRGRGGRPDHPDPDPGPGPGPGSPNP